MGLVTTKRAAEILGVTPIRVRQLIKDGQIRSEKQGRDHLLDETEVARFNREGRRPTGRPRKEDRKKVFPMR
jgi:site-specific DNA-methyltransferase (adenine-specific)